MRHALIASLSLLGCVSAILLACSNDDVNKSSSQTPSAREGKNSDESTPRQEQASEPTDSELEPWQQFVSADQMKLPEPLESVIWHERLDLALDNARAWKRPLFVTVRCLPCKQCAEFDSDVLEGSDQLTPLLKQFVTVRLTNMLELDNRILPWKTHQDLDLSWWGYLLSDEGALYGVYGGMDATGDKSRISEAGLAATLTRVLNYHYHPDRRRVKLEQHPDLNDGVPARPSDSEGYDAWFSQPYKAEATNECLHCHHVGEIKIQSKIVSGNFDKARDVYSWPFPENLGFSVERDHGLRVREVTPDSPAASAGLEVGDVVRVASNELLFSEADLRAILDPLPWADAEVRLLWQRGDSWHKGTLELPEGWRRYDLGWRKSVAEAGFGADRGFPWPLRVGDSERKKRGISVSGLAVKCWMPKQGKYDHMPAVAAGLTPRDIIVEINGKSPRIHGRALLSWFRMNFERDDEIELTLVNPKGERRTVTYLAPGF